MRSAQSCVESMYLCLEVTDGTGRRQWNSVENRGRTGVEGNYVSCGGVFVLPETQAGGDDRRQAGIHYRKRQLQVRCPLGG